MNKKVIVLSALSALSLGLTQAANAGWYGGDCADHYAAGGSGACIEYFDGASWWHINSHPGGASSFKGPFLSPVAAVPEQYESGAMGNFKFSGPTDLSCFGGDVTLSCDLALEGKVKKENGAVNIEIVAGEATGGGLCDNVVIGDFNWYIGDNSEHSSWGPGDGIAITGPGPYVGSVGSIGFTVENIIPILPPLVQISNSHIHDVTFDNNGSQPSFFRFGNDIVYNDNDDSTGCAIHGELYVEDTATYKDVNIHYQ